MSTLELNDYANRYIVERFSVVDGVARLQIGGERRYAMRIWLNKDAMASRNVTVADIESVLRNENVELPAGNVKSNDRDFIVRVIRTYKTQEDYRRLVVKKGDNNYLVRLGEVADVVLSSENEESEFRSDGKNVLGIGIIKQSKANTLDVVKNVRAEVERIAASLPEGTTIIPGYDSSLFIAESINEVYVTLGIAMVLVVLVIFVFLGSLRATFIPARFSHPCDKTNTLKNNRIFYNRTWHDPRKEPARGKRAQASPLCETLSTGGVEKWIDSKSKQRSESYANFLSPSF